MIIHALPEDCVQFEVLAVQDGLVVVRCILPCKGPPDNIIGICIELVIACMSSVNLKSIATYLII